MSYLIIYILVILAIILFAISILKRGKKNFDDEVRFFNIQGLEMNINEIEKYMKDLASKHKKVDYKKDISKLLKNMNNDWKELKKVYEYLLTIPEKITSLVPASQWLIDNYYIIEREAKVFEYNIKNNQYDRLPILTEGEFAGYPRVYAIAYEMIRCNGYHLDEDIIITLLNSYQTVTPLTVNEVWAFFDMIKLCLISNLNYVSTSVSDIVKVKQKADKSMDSILENNNSTDKLIELFDEHFSINNYEINHSLITHILYRLREVAIDDDILRRWLSNKMITEEVDLSSIIRQEGQNQAKLQIAVSSMIGSLKEESVLDYEKLFKEISYIDKILSKDPINLYSKMDFDTCIDYHKKVQKLSREMNVEETRVAEEAINLSSENYESDFEDKLSHVGYYLKGKGIEKLKIRLGYKKKVVTKLADAIKLTPGFWYFTSIFIVSAIIILFTLWYTLRINPETEAGLLALIVAVMLVPAITIAVEVVGVISMKMITPKKLPSMDFSKGIPDEYRTVVVMPVLLPSVDQVKDAIQRIESYYLANKDENLYFALLGDLKDSDTRESDADKEIIDAAVEGITYLNEKYSSDHNTFMLFQRNRKWNEKQGCWMGWERKRGMLEQFNSLISGEEIDSFGTVIADTSLLPTFKFVITIDAGTELVREGAQKLIGIMAHPLNTPVVNKDKSLVIDGYAIIQPKTGIRIDNAVKTHFSRMFAGQAGIDTYTPIIADVYQDIFDNASFTGKGIYDPRVFHDVVGSKLPQNAILSHDLLESCYVKCATASNIELMDDFPTNIASFFAREHRWIRGDWQLIPWLISKNPLSKLSKYKIFDNLRRTLIPISHILLIFFALTLFSWQFYVWGAIVLFTTLFPLLIHISKTTAIDFRMYGAGFNFLNYFRNMVLIIDQGLIWFMLIPYRAHITADAIIRTLYRVFISKKNLLEWKTADAVERSLSNNLISYVIRMWSCLVAGVLLIALANPQFKTFAIIVGALWFLAPFVSYTIGLPDERDEETLKHEEKEELRIVSRKTWRYFEEFFKEKYNWLIPDNYQVWPENGVATRTSTTNIGLQLLCTLGARDFGYIGILNMVNRIEKVFVTLSTLEKWNGHYFNWYDVETLDPLIPKYVSTVDSGNFLGSLIVLKNGLNEYKNRQLLDNSIIQGLRDTALLANIDFDVNEPQNINEWEEMLNELLSRINTSDKSVNKEWAVLLKNMCSDFKKDIKYLKTDKFDETLTLNELKNIENPNAEALIYRIDDIIKQIDHIIETTDFKPLYNERRNIFRIGFNATAGILENAYYDLLASEARLASFIAIAKGDVPQKHWFKLGRTLTLVDGRPTLVSWSGTMFEYLMPNLFMRLIPSTLLHQTAVGAIIRQIEYGKKKNIPWGMSEAAYYRFDQHLNYQYRAIGVPGLGFSSDLGKLQVIAPYATILSFIISPRKSYKNLELLRNFGAEGDYGFYEAVDFKTPMNWEYREHNVIKSFFAHHQGMSLVSLGNVLNDYVMHKRFHSEPIVRATDLVLEEKQPEFVLIKDEDQKDVFKKEEQPKRTKKKPVDRTIGFTNPTYPVAHVLSNNQYTVMLTSNGTGLSSLRDININRWRPDYTCDNYGMFFYIQDLNTKDFWSSTYQPVATEPDSYSAHFSLDKVEFKRKDEDIETKTEVIVSPQDNTEIRKVTLTNNGNTETSLEVTSYFEAVINNYNDDLGHPAFSKLFVETEYVEDKHTLLATRRPRASEDERKYLMHTVLVDDKAAEVVEYETDRSKFIGRGKTVKNPQAMTYGLNLSNTVGKVLDAIMSLRVRLNIEPGKSKTVTYVTGATDTREQAMKLAFEYRKPHVIEDSFKLALFHNDVEMQYLNITPQQANAVQEMVGSIYYPSSLLRAPEEVIKENNKSQSSLWRFGISGDYPIMLLRVNDMSHIDAVKDAIIAYEYLQLRGVRIDLVVLNELQEGYFQEFNQNIKDLLNNVKVFDINKPGPGAFLLQSNTMSNEEIVLLLTVARIVLTGKDRLLSKRIRNILLEEPVKNQVPYHFRKDIQYPEIPLPEEHLEFFNGIGGFANNGEEYVMILNHKLNTPAPWINVISNESFGCLVSANGAGHTWFKNSRENKLTMWPNDPVTEHPSEAIYIRDEVSGEYFTPTPLPVREETSYKVRHGFGYSEFEHNSMGISQKTTVFVPNKDPVKIYKISLENKTEQKRTLSLTYYTELVLGVCREITSPYIVTEMNNEVLMAKNTYNGDFPDNVAFMFSSEQISSFTGDRTNFLGKNGSAKQPQALIYKELSNQDGAGQDPCGTLKTNIDLQPGEQKEVIFALGEVEDSEQIETLVQTYRKIDNVNNSLKLVKENWKDLLYQIKVNTPDIAMNYLLNGWLLYQVMSCRILARSAYYQVSGAYGFRDQLQDVLSMLYTVPDITRDMILRHSSRQYFEGDVQHWWLPDSGRGVRTKISDDLLWLPYVTSEYVSKTGDISILDEVTSYLEDSELDEDEHERFSIPKVSTKYGTVYEHCKKAIERALKFGEHGLPLIGTGDWNDGMNKIGKDGKGESVWLAWFLYKVLNDFASICKQKGDNEAVDKYHEIAEKLVENIEEYAWDGEWYIRAYFDDGTVLGSRHNIECQIDSISQSWGVISNAANSDRASTAMSSVNDYLVKYDDQIILLLTPPFDKMEPDPGYIKGYIPGIRENGGQYTHAAAWSIIAFSKLRNGDLSHYLFNMLNPISHTMNYSAIMKYKNEPYVMSADVYSTSPHNGRGGWSWYTGAAGWMYQAGIEWILGIKKIEDKLIIDPTIPREWNEYSIEYSYKNTKYNITVSNPDNVDSGVASVKVDGEQIEDKTIQLVDDENEHQVEVTLGVEQ